MNYRISKIKIGILILITIPIITACLCNLSQPQPGKEKTELFDGITYIQENRQSPRKIVIHAVTIDLKQQKINFLVTPGNPSIDMPLKARTTSQFLEDFDLQLAINGDGFTPWHSNSLLDFYPHSGDPVTPLGLAASQSVVYSSSSEDFPVLYLSKSNQARFNSPLGKIYNAISGNQMLVLKGKTVAEIPQSSNPEVRSAHPRTAIGIDKHGKQLIILVVDGRQPGYSEGVTIAELTHIMIEYGAYFAMNLDGGGSTTLVMEDRSGKPRILNSPIDNQIPGRERPIANHLGIFVKSGKKQ